MLMGLSINPLEKWFHLHRRRTANFLVKSKYEVGKKIIDFSCAGCDWNANELPVFNLGVNEDELQIGVKEYDDVTIILPTLNEEENILKILLDLRANYNNSTIIVADDGSQDGTNDAVISLKDSDIIFLDRGNKHIHGLTASVLDAIDLAKTKYVIVLDADGQHPPNKIGEIVNMLRHGSALVVASRVDVGKRWGLFRKVLSYMGASLGKFSLLAQGKNYISYDILSGFFGFERNFWNDSLEVKSKQKQFRLKGYKILFDFLKALSTRIEIEKVYYILKTRRAGISKINVRIYAEFLKSCFLF